jgi:hypothetical protein
MRCVPQLNLQHGEILSRMCAGARIAWWRMRAEPARIRRSIARGLFRKIRRELFAGDVVSDLVGYNILKG